MYGIDPIDINDTKLSRKWKQFRCDAISSLVKELKAIAKNKNKKSIFFINTGLYQKY